MSARRILRGVLYRLGRHPDSEVTLTARCISGDGCRWLLDATADLEAGGAALIEHTAATGHALFARSVEDVALVVRHHQEQRAAGPRPKPEPGPGPEPAEEHSRTAWAPW
ncbi:hypothetical protein [Streptomyces sp. cg36]|uniref:hypothetical protein n=1 Tax=Streptomyces sp. cg36 TaxID=3238798 RepID=UPI0034E1BE0E